MSPTSHLGLVPDRGGRPSSRCDRSPPRPRRKRHSPGLVMVSCGPSRSVGEHQENAGACADPVRRHRVRAVGRFAGADADADQISALGNGQSIPAMIQDSSPLLESFPAGQRLRAGRDTLFRPPDATPRPSTVDDLWVPWSARSGLSVKFCCFLTAPTRSGQRLSQVRRPWYPRLSLAGQPAAGTGNRRTGRRLHR
jgi:hypothetical protein